MWDFHKEGPGVDKFYRPVTWDDMKNLDVLF